MNAPLIHTTWLVYFGLLKWLNYAVWFTLKQIKTLVSANPNIATNIWIPLTLIMWTKTFKKKYIFFFVLSRTVIQVWNDKRVSKCVELIISHKRIIYIFRFSNNSRFYTPTARLPYFTLLLLFRNNNVICILIFSLSFNKWSLGGSLEFWKLQHVFIVQWTLMKRSRNIRFLMKWTLLYQDVSTKNKVRCLNTVEELILSENKSQFE